jgi:hypothetical protein
MGKRRIAAAALAGVLVLGLAACGDDGGDDEDVSLEDAGSDGGSGDGSSTDDTEADSTDDTGSGDVDLPAGFGTSEECIEMAGAYASLNVALLGGAFGGEDFDPDEILERVDAVGEDAPDEVQDAIDTVVDTYAEVRENLGGEFNITDILDPDTADALDPLNSEEFNEANQVVADYFEEVCTPGD